ncbi:MAG TPA: hypothetical protein VGN91_10595 [Bosea sp. (in: a-proteobacteria)]|jgi:hypothetical protein|nr:hypothetical protein [Bosea sp. (in: a-proteobacteria)]
MTDPVASLSAQLDRLKTRRQALEIELGELLEQINLAESALAAMRELRRRQMPGGGRSPAAVDSTRKKLPRVTLDYLRKHNNTIKAQVIGILSSKKDGKAEALQILEELNRINDQKFDRTSLSPQLSRLKQQGIISHESPYWKLNYE